MVMGFALFHSEVALRHIASTRFFTLFCVSALLLILCAECGESLTCSVDDCSNPYKRACRRLEGILDKNPSADTSKKYCRVLKKLHRCLHRQRRVCRGNLLYHSLKHVGDTKMKDSNCSRKSGSSNRGKLPVTSHPQNRNAKSSLPTATVPQFSTVGPVESDACSYKGTSKYRHCGMFGDPHLRTFSDEFNTCTVKGTWPLINNDYLVVMVTNVPVKEGSSATATTRITVLINESGSCAERQYFVAQSGQLPGAFVDGSSVSGSVEVVEVETDKRVEIRVRFLGTTIIIRQVAQYLTFAIRMPEEFIPTSDSRMQLCDTGCPAAHQISPIKKPTNSDPAVPLLTTPPPPREHPEQNLPKDDPIFPYSTTRYFSEEEARVKCRQILLGLPEMTSKKNESTLQERLMKHAKKKQRMAAAKRPDDDVIRASFKRLQGVSDVESSSSILPQRERAKRDASFPRSSGGRSKRCSTSEEESNNFYFDSCVFDLVTTGDLHFADAAKVAWEDVMRTHVMRNDAPGTSVEVIRRWDPSLLKLPDCTLRNQPSEVDGNGGNGGGGRILTPGYLLTLFCLLASYFCVSLATHSYESDVTVKSTKRRDSKRFVKSCKSRTHIIACGSS